MQYASASQLSGMTLNLYNLFYWSKPEEVFHQLKAKWISESNGRNSILAGYIEEWAKERFEQIEDAAVKNVPMESRYFFRRLVDPPMADINYLLLASVWLSEVQNKEMQEAKKLVRLLDDRGVSVDSVLLLEDHEEARLLARAVLCELELAQETGCNPGSYPGSMTLVSDLNEGKLGIMFYRIPEGH